MNVDHHLRSTLQIHIEQRQALVALQARQAFFNHQGFAKNAGGFGQGHRQVALQRCAMRQLGVVIRVAQFVGRGLRRIYAAAPVEQHERTIVDERHAKCTADFSFAGLGIDPFFAE